ATTIAGHEAKLAEQQQTIEQLRADLTAAASDAEIRNADQASAAQQLAATEAAAGEAQTSVASLQEGLARERAAREPAEAAAAEQTRLREEADVEHDRALDAADAADLKASNARRHEAAARAQADQVVAQRDDALRRIAALEAELAAVAD